MNRFLAAAAVTTLIWMEAATAAPRTAPALPGPEAVIAAKRDLWGEAALRQPGGPTYAFFAKLLPPLRYVDAGFHHYPIVLSAPGALAKARLVGDGSALNALARQPNWKNEEGVPLHVAVGDTREPFGADPGRLEGPRYAGGFLPIVQLAYTYRGERYGEEVFAPVEEALAAAGAVTARFDFPAADRGRIDLRFEYGPEVLTARDGKILTPGGKCLAAYDANWEWYAGRSALVSKTAHAPSGCVTLFTRPVEPPAAPPAGAEFHQRERDRCAGRWRDLLAAGMNVEVPEPVVNDAWRSLVVGTHMILAGDQLNYSAANQYARLYAHESGETLRSLVVWGYGAEMERTIPPLFVYRRPNIEYHDGAFKLRLLADTYFVTRDAEMVRRTRPLWQKEIDLILAGRDPVTGLLPREKYCSDIDTRIRSNNANANCWRGLRDMALVLEDLGEREEAARLAAIAVTYRQQVLAAIEQSAVRRVDPPFIPIAMDGEEPVPDPVTGTRLGSYWNLVVQQLLGSGVFAENALLADDIMRYMRENGALCMGMLRVQSNRGWWVNPQNIDDLYTVRYALLLQQRDEPDRALVSFYGKLVQGMTRDTFLDGESSSIVPEDRFGRQFYLPPNSTANASFLEQLRGLLVQDLDLDGDGRIESLRLLFATPRAWLRDGAVIKVERAPTAFGELGLTVRSELAKGRVTADLSLPARQLPTRTRLRLRLPAGYSLGAVRANGEVRRTADRETVDLTGLKGVVKVEAAVRRVNAGQP